MGYSSEPEKNSLCWSVFKGAKFMSQSNERQWRQGIFLLSHVVIAWVKSFFTCYHGKNK